MRRLRLSSHMSKPESVTPTPTCNLGLAVGPELASLSALHGPSFQHRRLLQLVSVSQHSICGVENKVSSLKDVRCMRRGSIPAAEAIPILRRIKGRRG